MQTKRFGENILGNVFGIVDRSQNARRDPEHMLRMFLNNLVPVRRTIGHSKNLRSPSDFVRSQ
jgi:hypothetical protein